MATVSPHQLRATNTVDRLIDEKATPPRVLAHLREIAADPRNMHYTPYLIGALREAGFWPALAKAAIRA
jgi:hypothetical protein